MIQNENDPTVNGSDPVIKKSESDNEYLHRYDGIYPMEKLIELRKILSDQYEKNKDVWDSRLYEDLMVNDNLCQRYLRRRRGKVELAASLLDSALRWHKEMGITEATDQSFPREFYLANAIYINGEDDQGNILLVIRVSNVFNSPGISPLLKKFIAYQLLKADRLSAAKGSDYGWVEVLDCSEAGVANADVDLLGFINGSLKNYFPAGQKYVLVVDLNWLLTAIKTVAFGWLPASVRRRVKFCTRKNISFYIPPKHQTIYWGSATEVPKDCPTLDELRKAGVVDMSDYEYEKATKFIQKIASQ
ncbi:motile sperm domain-containing protein 2-like [Brevipalpus obovatus]|uniref:motile sperm domain-containing protein 2-like n=1 Tax=Brevipalpus obovatus TaxID=246614 RepID=UPI003D9DD542